MNERKTSNFLTFTPDLEGVVVIHQHVIRIQLIVSLIHEDSHADFPHTIIHQVGGVDELILIHLLARGAAQSLNCYIHTLGKVG